MYTLPKPSKGAPTATSGEEIQYRVTPCTLGPTVPQPCAPGHRAQHGIDLPVKTVLRASGNRALWLRIKTGTTGHPIASFIRGKLGPEEGSDLPKVTQQVNVSSRPKPQISDHWLLFVFPYCSAFLLPDQPPLQTPGPSNDIYQQGHKSRCYPLVTLPGSYQALMSSSPHKSTGSRYYFVLFFLLAVGTTVPTS